jgi:hypothetical protein
MPGDDPEQYPCPSIVSKEKTMADESKPTKPKRTSKRVSVSKKKLADTAQRMETAAAVTAVAGVEQAAQGAETLGAAELSPVLVLPNWPLEPAISPAPWTWQLWPIVSPA